MKMIFSKKILSAVDKTKRIALAGLAKKNQKQQTYPIVKKDLLCIPRCPFCQSSRLKHLAEVSLISGLLFFRTSVCQNCVFVFRSISPSFAWFKKCWRMIDNGKLEVFNPEAEKYKKFRYQEYLAIVKKYLSRGSALEIGGGYGTGTKLFQQAGFDMEVIESEVSKARYIQEHLGIPVVDDDIFHFLNSTNKKYNLILFSNCLEHLDHPIAVMKKLKQILKPGGVVLVAVPILWDYVIWTDALYLTHKVNFSQEHLLALSVNSSFETLEMKNVPYVFDNSQEILLILRAAARPSPISLKLTSRQQKELVNEIAGLYHSKLPFSSKLVKNVIKYQVPHIDQFFQTVNLENKIIIPPHSQKGFIKIIPKYTKK